MKAKLAEMEAEAAKLREIQAKVEKDLSTQCELGGGPSLALRLELTRRIFFLFFFFFQLSRARPTLTHAACLWAT